MKLEYVPLLQLQRDLYAMPRGFERFREYIATMVDPESKDLKLPLVAMNPMGKDHIPALLDQYLGFEADRLAAEQVAEVASSLQAIAIAGDFKVTLVISDDAMGAWTNRIFTEFGHRFQSKPMFRRGWLPGILWTSEKPAPQSVRWETALVIYRAAYIQQHGFAKTLGEMMVQEGFAMHRAGCPQPTLDCDDLDYTRQVLAPLLAASDQPTQIAALFGDEAARSVGYAPLGLSERAGFALALAETVGQ